MLFCTFVFPSLCEFTTEPFVRFTAVGSHDHTFLPLVNGKAQNFNYIGDRF